MAHEIGVIYPLANGDQISRGAFWTATLRRSEMVFSLLQAEDSERDRALRNMLFDLVSTIDALKETDQTREQICAEPLGGLADLVSQVEALWRVLDANRKGGGNEVPEWDIEAFAAGLHEALADFDDRLNADVDPDQSG